MKVQELRLKTPSELKDIISQSFKELMNYRFQKTMGQLASSAKMRQTRRQIARVKTIMQEQKNQQR